MFTDTEIRIADDVTGQPESAVACLHFDHRVKVEQQHPSGIVADGVSVVFEAATSVALEEYLQALGFNKRCTAVCVKVAFSERLVTRIQM